MTQSNKELNKEELKRSVKEVMDHKEIGGELCGLMDALTENTNTTLDLIGDHIIKMQHLAALGKATNKGMSQDEYTRRVVSGGIYHGFIRNRITALQEVLVEMGGNHKLYDELYEAADEFMQELLKEYAPDSYYAQKDREKILDTIKSARSMKPHES